MSQDEPETRWARAARQFSDWRDGEAAALDDLVRTLSPTLWHVARAYGLDHHVAEDVVQSSWLTLVRKHDDVADPQAITAWLMTITRREAWRVAKAGSRDTPVETIVLDLASEEAPDAESQVITSDEASRLWEHVQRLSERCQRLLRVIAFCDRPDYQTLAADLGMPVGSIGPTRGRCLAKLRSMLDDDGGSDHDRP